MPDEVLEHLRALVRHDTTNPPRDPARVGAIVDYVMRSLQGAGCTVHVDDLGSGCVNVLATRDSPRLLINCHLDTVPTDGGWSRDPFALAVKHGRAIGLGACDVKGAAACLLAALHRTKGPAAVLFTTDEEAGQATCVRTFLRAVPSWVQRVVVSEPTQCQVVTEHRAVLTATRVFLGDGGHTSQPLNGHRSAIHDAMQWSARCLDDPVLRAERLNFGAISGGVKANVVAATASLTYGLRPSAAQSLAALQDRLAAHTPDGARTQATERFRAPGLHPSGHDFAAELAVPQGSPVDFWTEAALFAEAGLPAAVFGPGDIAQAHTPYEFIELEQLERASDTYTHLFS
ncbi:MAG: acetylornithine deacetylase [Phycisphaerales bacterium]|nr:acetylornithine deacetylase [Phycisphaerales bacterium]